MARKKKVIRKKKAVKKKVRRAARKANDMLLVASKTKEAIKAYDLNMAADAMDGLNQWIHFLIDQGCRRAVQNGRKTVRPHDFMVM